MSRRDVGMGSAAAVAWVAGCTPRPSTAGGSSPASRNPASESAESSEQRPTQEETTGAEVVVETPDGLAEGYLVSPKSGRYPGVLMWPDVAGLRDAFRTMATGLAREGFAVLTVNPYYRSSRLPILANFSQWRTPEGKALIAPMRDKLDPDAVARDARAFTAFLDNQPQVDRSKKMGTCGYCMSGSFAIRTGAVASGRVGVVASFHGGGLVTEDSTSPHRLLPSLSAALLICIAQNDDQREPAAKSVLRAASETANLSADVQVYPAAHGFCVVDSPVYDEAQAARARGKMLALFKAHL